MSNLTNNTAELQSILAAVNALPDSTGGGTGRDGVGIRQITLKSQTESGNTYTVHLTDGTSYDFTAPAGPQGVQGEDGTSPYVTVEEIEGGHRITITDANGTKRFDVMDGEGGSGSPEKCIVSIEPDIMDPYYIVRYSDGTYEYVGLPEDGIRMLIADHNHVAEDITGGTLGGPLVAEARSQASGRYLLRNIKVGLTAEDPTTEGEIFFKCK